MHPTLVVLTIGVSIGQVLSAPAAHAACGWELVPSPSVTTRDNVLNDVDAVSPADVWAVGFYQQVGGPTQTLILHWDGASWSIVPAPNPGTESNFLSGVAAVSANDVWAVGYVKSTGPYRTMILHWDGVAWTQVESPTVGTKANFLAGVDAASAQDVWAVGHYEVHGSDDEFTLTLHWDGGSWSVIPSPNPDTHGNALSAVDARTASDVWAVGWRDINAEGLALHWNGSGWAPSPIPSGLGAHQLTGVSAIASDDVWAVGDRNRDGTDALVEHWDGSSWTVVRGVNDDFGLVDVSGVIDDSVWAVGERIHRWDGSRWRAFPGSGAFLGRRAVHAISPTEAWSVGGTWINNNYRTRTEHLTC